MTQKIDIPDVLGQWWGPDEMPAEWAQKGLSKEDYEKVRGIMRKGETIGWFLGLVVGGGYISLLAWIASEMGSDNWKWAPCTLGWFLLPPFVAVNWARCKANSQILQPKGMAMSQRCGGWIISCQVGNQVTVIGMPEAKNDMHPMKDPDEAFKVALAESCEAQFEASVNAFHYDEPAASFDPAEAALISQERAASWVDRQAPPAEQVALANGTDDGLGLLVLTFSRHPAALIEALLNSPPAQAASAQGVDLQPSWARGGRVFADGVHAGLFDEELSAYQVVICEKDEDAIMASLHDLPYGIRKLKPGMGRAAVPGRLDQFAISSAASSGGDIGNDDIEVTVKNTFIHVCRARCDCAQSVRTV